MKKTALIIGGTGGIGYAIAKLFDEHNIQTYVTYFKNQKTADEMKDSFKNCIPIKCDITKENNVKNTVDQILKNNSNIDIVVNTSTSSLKLKPFEQLTSQDFTEDINVSIMGAVNIYKHVTPVMKKNKSGLIINFLTETIVDKPPSRMSSYVTAKSGLLGLTKSLSVELKRFNVSTLAISPSFVETDLLKSFPTKFLEIMRERNPDKNFILPVDIAKVVLKIVNNPNKYETGKNYIFRNTRDVLRMVNDEKNCD